MSSHARHQTTLATALLAALGIVPILAPGLAAEELNSLALRLVAEHHERIQPLEIEVARRYWDANVCGTREAFRLKQEAENRLDAALSDHDWFARLKRCDAAPLADPLLARQIRLLYLQTLPRQVDRELLGQLVARANGLEMRFNTYRPCVGDEQFTANEVRRVLRESTDSKRRRAVWESSKAVGGELRDELLALVRLRNQAARQLGFIDYYEMQLLTNEQTPQQVLRLFDELDELTHGPFLAAKREIDVSLAGQCGVTVDELRPWHYHDPFFREVPLADLKGLDAIYARVDVVELCRKFYAGIGLSVDDVLLRSDLYEKPKKHPSAFCLDIDRAGDVRVLANVEPREFAMSTMLHELGHAVYSSKNMPAELPYLLRCESHILTTEGVAMMFEPFSKDAQWLRQMGVDVDDHAALVGAMHAVRRQKLLVFARLSQVVQRFERELYRDPDQDLNRLWWDLVEKYQGLTRPEGRDSPDYASQLHIVTAPAYFHNYMLGELFACQLRDAIARDALGGVDPRNACYVGRVEVGRFLRERVFEPGRRLGWNELTKFATGEALGVRAFAEEVAE